MPHELRRQRRRGMTLTPRLRANICMTISPSLRRREAVVDEDAGELVADGPVQQRSDHRESTPPERPRITSSLPTWARTFSIASLT